MTTPHPDDEQLSAHLDGEAGDGTAAHLRSCRDCEQRLAGLRLVSSCVGSSVAGPPDRVREAALQAARTSWLAVRAEDAGRSNEAEVLALEGHRRVPRWALPVAAAAAALMVAVPVLGSLGDDKGGQETAATSDERRSSAGRDAEAVGIDGGDLGEQSDPATLALAISDALPGSASDAALAAPSAPPAGGAGEPLAEAGAPTSSPAFDQEARTSSAPATAKAKKLGERPCAEIVRSTYGQGLGPLVYTASVRWKGAGVDATAFPTGIPAVVLAYRLADPGPPGLDYRVMVMAREDCRLLVAPSL